MNTADAFIAKAKDSYMFPSVARLAADWDTFASPRLGQKYGSLVGAGLADALFLLPKVVLGSEVTLPEHALRPGVLKLRERGMVGSVAFGMAKIVQFVMAGAGALIGAGWSLTGIDFESRTRDWTDLGAGKGWQLGTLVGIVIMSASETVRSFGIGLEGFLSAILCTSGSTLGSMLHQALDIVTSAPNYHSLG